jgi:hypothetical protein
MARRIAHAEWTGQLANGRGEVRIAGEHLGLAYTPAWLQEGANWACRPSGRSRRRPIFPAGPRA